MSSRRLTGLWVAGAVLALTGAISVHAQMLAPMPPPDRVEVYSYSDAPKVDPGDNPANWSARENVAESQRYDQLTKTNPAFRAARIRKECGSITEPSLYQQCVATFN